MQENIPQERKNETIIKAKTKSRDKCGRGISKEQTKQPHKKITNLTDMTTRIP